MNQPKNTDPDAYRKYEAGKKQIARTAKNHEEYEERVRELARRLGI